MELILSEITRMGSGYCVIGLARKASGSGYESTRPMPRLGYSWPIDFLIQRGHRIEVPLQAAQAAPPHVEDRITLGRPWKTGEIPEDTLVGCLRQAEVAERPTDLFGCAPHDNRPGRGYYVDRGKAIRSICGTPLVNIRFSATGSEVRAEVTLKDGSHCSLPIVDTVWMGFFEKALAGITGTNLEQRRRRFLQGSLPTRLLIPSLFARIGITRPFQDKCWLMLDSLFPQPREEWLEDCK